MYLEDHEKDNKERMSVVMHEVGSNQEKSGKEISKYILLFLDKK